MKEQKKHPKAFGTVLENEELDRLNNRLNKLDEIVPKIKEKMKKESNTEFGGIIVKQEEGGKIYIGIKEKDKKLKTLSEIKSTFSYEDINLFEVEYSESELIAARDKLLEHAYKLQEQNIYVYSIDIEIENNNLSIGLKEATNLSEEYLKEILGEIPFTTFNTIQPENTSRQSMIRPLQAGLRLYNVNGGGCTSAFNAYVNNSEGTAYYLLTAGHCGNKHDPFTQGGGGIGYMTKRFNANNADAGGIPIISAYKTHYVYGVSSNSYEITSIQRKTEDYVGQSVCFAGSYSNSQICGTIKSTNWSGYFLGGNYFYNLRMTSQNNISGDSGSPVYERGKAMGIAKGTTGSNMVYSHIDYVISSLGLTSILVK